MSESRPKDPPPPPETQGKPAEKRKPKPRARYTRETYDRILAGYRGAPGNHAQAARYAQVDRAMARGAWTNGFPRQYRAGADWARPVRDVLREEVEAARVARAEANRRERERQDAERERARAESVEELAEEGRLRGVARKDLLAVALVCSQMVPAVQALAGVVKGAVVGPDGRALQTPGVSPMQAMKLLKDYGTVVSRVAYAAETIVQLGRTVRGQSNLNVNVQDLSPEEALEELEMAAEVLAEARRLRAAERALAPGSDPDDEADRDGAVH